MKNIKRIAKLLVVAAAILTTNSCERRPLEYTFHETALIPVSIDWSKTGFAMAGRAGDDYVHRVSIRFFPKDGSAAFDKYLESDISQGEISVPVGKYSVVIFNEAITDTYWQDAIQFTDVNDYNKFAASVVENSAENGVSPMVGLGDKLAVEPKRLASWNLDNFEVSGEMVTRTRSKGVESKISKADTKATDQMIDALSDVVMRPLTYQVSIRAAAVNLSSAQSITCLKRGFAGKVYMASTKRGETPVNYLFDFSARKWDDHTQTHGTAERTFLTFGILPATLTNARYSLELDVIFVTGERFVPGSPLLFDITEQVRKMNESTWNHALNLDIDIPLSLPKVDEGVSVGEWEEESVTIN